MTVRRDSVTRILYIGDVVIEHSYAGRAMLYRMLESHPPDQLLVLEGGLGNAETMLRLPGVVHRTIHTPFDRLCRSRFHAAARALRLQYAEVIVRRLRRTIAAFKPDVVLSVAFEQFWWAAVRISQVYGPKLVLALHDDWLTTTPIPRWWRPLSRRCFRRALRVAHARLCISPYMRDVYRMEYGVDSTVLYPVRPSGMRAFEQPKRTTARRDGALVVGYAGSLMLAGYPRFLEKVAEVLESMGGELVIFSGDRDAMRRWPGLGRKCVSFNGFVPNPNEALLRLRESVDVLCLPASFFEKERVNMGMLFPSKLAQYTATGLPILVAGPSYASCVRWAKEYPGVADIVESEEAEEIREALVRLQSREYREDLAWRALEVGGELFRYETGIREFYRALAG